MKHAKLTRDRAVELLEAAVALNGTDYVYNEPVVGTSSDDNGRPFTYTSCVYFDDGLPSCGVGHVLAAIGITEKDLDGQNVDCIISQVPGVHDWMDGPAVQFLQVFQREQDAATPWGEALDRAKAART